MPDKLMRLWRHDAAEARRPVMIAIAGDSAAGKTTLTRGIAETLGADRATALCVDDYHRHDRAERKDIPFTVLHPDCNYIDVMEQHLQLLALGRPVLKPVYDHSTGSLVRPVLVEPREFVIVEGLLPLHTKLARACFDITVYLDPPEEIRRKWKIRRDCAERGYTPGAVLAELDRREPVDYLRRIGDGEVLIDPALAGRVALSAARLHSGEFWPGAHLGLTQRESEVLSLLVAGLSNRAIAAKLVVSEETVKTHSRGIYRKLGVSDRAAAVTVALREGVFH
jgi:uridine kinase/DNA-binding CsgD family transcriptional regulator